MKMKATKAMALILSVLMVISSMVFVATAEKLTHGSSLVTYKFTSTKETENAYYDDSLRVGSAQTNTGSSVDWAGRYADGTRYFGYAFPITGSTMPTAIEFRARMRGDLLIQVSVDKTNLCCRCWAIEWNIRNCYCDCRTNHCCKFRCTVWVY